MPPKLRGRRAEYIPEFDLLRSLAIGLLFFHHGGLYNLSFFGIPLTALNHYVELFLLGSFTFLSGYLMVHSVEGKSLSDFLKSRLLRIYHARLHANLKHALLSLHEPETAEQLATGIAALIDGVWLRAALTDDTGNRAQALKLIEDYIDTQTGPRS